MRHLALVLAALQVATCVPVARATELYVYVGNSPSRDVAPFENMIGRKVDGLVWFNDYRYAPEFALANLQRGLVAIPKGYKLAISIGLAFGQPSNDAAHRGAHTLQDIAAGKLDGLYAGLGAALVAHGFAAADVRLGWEEDGDWYRWAAHPDEAAFRAAFTRIYRVLHATPGSHFTVWFNPGVGFAPDKDIPAVGAYDGVAWDTYACAGMFSADEPALWDHALNGAWGIKSEGVWPSTTTPLAIPEFGVGSEASGKGAPDADHRRNGGDDGLFMANALNYFLVHKARFIGYWDFNAGDYNAKISDGSRPHEALAFLGVMGPPPVVALLKGARLSATKIATPAGMHDLVADLPGGSKALLLWGDDRRSRRFDLALPAPLDVAAVLAQGERAMGRTAAIRGFVYAGGLSVLRLTP